MVKVTCPGCRKVLLLADHLSGKKVSCRQCQHIFVVGDLVMPPQSSPRIVPVVPPASRVATKKLDPLQESIQSRPGQAPPPPSHPPDYAPPRKRSRPGKSSGTSFGLIVGGMTAGAVVLVGLVIAAILAFRGGSSSGNDSERQEAVAKAVANAVKELRQEESQPQLAREQVSARPQPAPQEVEPREDPPAPRPARPESKPEAPAPQPLPADNNAPIPAKLLDHLKSATLFVRVEGKEIVAFGSGFVMKVQGDTAYVVTNAHVIDPKIEVEVPAPRGGGPGPGRGLPAMPQIGPRFGPPGGFPRGPIGPRGPFGPPPMLGRPQQSDEETRKVVVPIGDAVITLVFWSGTKKEQSYRAQVVSSDRQRDLAILKVAGGKNLPQPIDCSQVPNLQETMPIYVFGFPFGDMLGFSKGNPAITVGKGSVSSIRRDEKDEVAYVQIDGALNPGNSGGPVVDSQGRLVGVAVKTIKGAGIGLAIPATKLTAMLQGKAEIPGSRLPRVQKLFAQQPRVFLSDLEEFGVKDGPWPVSKNGKLGDPDQRPIQVNGVRSPKGMSMHPPDEDYSGAMYRLGKQAKLFKARVALNDTTNTSPSAAVFEVRGDDRVLWRSDPISQSRHPQRCRVDVAEVDVLELRVYSTGTHFNLHAVWIEPRLLQKADTPDK